MQKKFSPIGFNKWEESTQGLVRAQVFCQMLMDRAGVYSQPYYNGRKVNAECFVITSVIEWLMQCSCKNVSLNGSQAHRIQQMENTLCNI